MTEKRTSELNCAADLKKTKIRLIVAITVSVVLLYISMGHMLIKDLPLPYFMDMHRSPLVFAIVQLLLTSVILFTGNRFYASGFLALIKRMPNMDTLIAIGTGSAYLYSIFALIKIALGDLAYVSNLFFEPAAIVVTLVMVGKYLEDLSKSNASDAIKKLTELTPGKANTQNGDDQIKTEAPITLIADKISAYFVPAVIIIAMVSAVIWLIVGKDIEFALNIFVSVLVITCPCVLGLAASMAVIIGTGRGAQLGILYKSGEALQSAHGITHVVLDKTGTLTQGKLRITKILAISILSEKQLLSLCASAEVGSEYPAARVIVEEAKARELKLYEADEITVIPGCGVQARISEKISVLVGNEALMLERQIDISEFSHAAEEYSKTGAVIIYCAVSNKLAGIIAAADTLREESVYAVDLLHRLSLKVTMLTGDNESAANKVALAASIDNVIANILPGNMAEAVRSLRADGEKVAMVGDGTNDAPALAAADVGIAIGTGTDIAMQSAHVILINGDLKGVSDAIALSRAVIRNIKQNLFGAFIYNCLGIPLATGLIYAFGGPLLNPIFSSLAMALSSIFIIANAQRLKSFKP